MQFKVQSLGNVREPYTKGPHMKYFVTAIAIALAISTVIIGGLIGVVRWIVG